MVEQMIIVALMVLVIALMALLKIQSRRYKHIRKITKPVREYTRELHLQNKLLRDQVNHCSTDKY